jgi:ribosomal protein S18 acetylase RimI-like enzyme
LLAAEIVSVIAWPMDKAAESKNTQTKIRAMERDDLPALKSVIDAAELFPSEMLDDMVSGYLSGDATNEFWLTIDDGRPVGVAYYVQERMTQGTWNLLLIAVHPDRQGQGQGSALLNHVEDVLAERGERILLVETSGLPNFERTRRFYRKSGYDEEALIRDFYQTGEDKIIFRKALNAPHA